MTTGKTTASAIWTFVGRVTRCLALHNIPTKKQPYSNLITAVTVHSDFRAQEEEICHCFHLSPSICHEVMGPDAVILFF